MLGATHAAPQKCALVLRYSLLVLVYEIQRCGIDAVAKTSGPRTIGENVAEVRITAAAEHFLAGHPVARVPIHFHFCFIDRRPEARPSGARMIFRLRAKLRLATWYCSGVRICRHSESGLRTFSLITSLPANILALRGNQMKCSTNADG